METLTGALNTQRLLTGSVLTFVFHRWHVDTKVCSFMLRSKTFLMSCDEPRRARGAICVSTGAMAHLLINCTTRHLMHRKAHMINPLSLGGLQLHPLLPHLPLLQQAPSGRR
jgi:hypothetical protein